VDPDAGRHGHRHRASAVPSSPAWTASPSGSGPHRQEGPHRELLAKGGAYARLWNRQMGGFINAA
jgi:ATP-binding cassette subfamily B multidrug efflux pump